MGGDHFCSHLEKNHFNLSGAHVVWILGDLHVRGLLDQSWPMAVRGGEILLTLLFSSVENFLTKKLILWLQVKAEMVLGRLVQKDGHLATDVDGNPRKVRLGQRQMQS